MLDPRREVTDLAVPRRRASEETRPHAAPGEAATTAEAATYVALEGGNARESRHVSAAILANAARPSEH